MGQLSEGPVRRFSLASASLRCLLWVKSRHRKGSAECALYPQKQTFTRRCGMSALCQKADKVRRSKDSTENVLRSSLHAGSALPKKQRIPRSSARPKVH